jgi:hypothetical protein
MRTYNAARGDESSLKIVTRHSRRTTNKIDSKRRSVQSQTEFGLIPLAKSGFPTAVDNTFFSFHVRDMSLKNEASNEQSWLVISVGPWGINDKGELAPG